MLIARYVNSDDPETTILEVEFNHPVALPNQGDAVMLDEDFYVVEGRSFGYREGDTFVMLYMDLVKNMEVH